MGLILIAGVLNSCCTFCKPKVVTKVEYRYPDFQECIDAAKKINYTYPALPKVSRRSLSVIDAKVLMDNLALRQKEVEALRDVQYCFLKNLQKFVDTFKEKKDD